MISNPSNSLEWMVFLAQKYSSMFIKGTWLTLYISVVGTLLGFVLGYIVGIVNDVKLNDGDNIVKKVLIRIVKVIFTVYVEVFRDTPMIVQAMIVYYGIRQMGYENLTPVFAGIQEYHSRDGKYIPFKSEDDISTQCYRCAGAFHGCQDSRWKLLQVL